MARRLRHSGACFSVESKEPEISLKLIQLARKSGELNLSNRGFITVPDVVWNVNSLDESEKQSITVSLDNSGGDEKWWEFRNVSRLYLNSNQLTAIPDTIKQLDQLEILELQDNKLTTLPAGIGCLEKLTRLNVSRNEITKIPDEFYSLKSIRTWICHDNALTELSEDITNLSTLEALDLSHNKLKRLPDGMCFLSRITSLNLSHNQLVNVPHDIGSMTALKQLDLSCNAVKVLPESMSELVHLERLELNNNVLETLPTLLCPKLELLTAAFNRITVLFPEFLVELPSLKVLSLRDNKISELPPEIVALASLERLDVSNNNLASIPYALGLMTRLSSLLLEGNPLKMIRRDILQRGTTELKMWLRGHLSQTDEPAVPLLRSTAVLSGVGEKMNKSFSVFSLKAAQKLDFSCSGATDIPSDIIEAAIEAKVSSVVLSKNKLSLIPDMLQGVAPYLSEFEASFNLITAVPSWISLAMNLAYLNMQNNLLSQLPDELGELQRLREINIAHNRFIHFPSVLGKLASLEIIIASNNKIGEIDLDSLTKLTRLATLDLANNDIGHVPPQLGLLKQICCLQLEGNAFRVPRAAILQKGTQAILTYLENQIPQ